MTATPDADEKLRALHAILGGWKRLAVAYSGGVDSVFLLKAAADALGPENVVAVTIQADNFPEREYADAREYAVRFGVRHVEAKMDVFSVPGFADNPPDRCYHCKMALFGKAKEHAAALGCDGLADGANADDANDYRPGTAAARELGVVSPLQAADLNKKEIRGLLAAMNIPLAAKPSFACLATRIPYGTPITPADLRRIGAAEQYFVDLGFGTVRVRQHGEVARIEVEPGDRDRFSSENLWAAAAAKMEELGYAFSALDLRGYRSGGMNDGLAERISASPDGAMQ